MDHTAMSHPLSLLRMEPLTLCSLASTIIKLIHQQYQLFSRLEVNSRQSLKRFLSTSEALASDLSLYNSLLQVYVHHRSGRTFSEVFRNENAKDAFNQLRTAINTVDWTLKHYDSAVASRANRVPNRNIANVLTIMARKEEIERNTEFIEDRAVQLTACRDQIAQAFKLFHSFYLLHPSSQMAQLQKAIRVSRRASHALDYLLSSFFKRPFGVRPGENIKHFCDLNKDWDTAEKCVKVMADAGKGWVDDQVRDKETMTISALGRLQARLMELIWSCSLEAIQPSLGDSDNETPSDVLQETSLLEESLKEAIARAHDQKFSIAFCGVVKAGKSLFLNALIGRTILPSENLPSTAWPCRLRHLKGQTIPRLDFDPTPFHEGIKKLQECGYGTKMKSYRAPKEDPFARILDEEPDHDEHLVTIYRSWCDLPKSTRENLMLFEDKKFRLRGTAEGEPAVKELLGQLNDIVRLCHRFTLGFDTSNNNWPVLVVEFDSFRERNVEGTFEFIDLPGLGEGFDDFDFEDMIRRVVMEAHAIVPILTLKDLSKEDWKRLAAILSSGCGGERVDFVVCTHLDLIPTDNLEEHLLKVTKVFWPQSPGSTDRVIPCSSLMGLSASALLHMSSTVKPQFENFWGVKKIEYHCAQKILGTGRPKNNFSSFSLGLWQKFISAELKSSRLPGARQRLGIELVARARQKQMVLEGGLLMKRVHKLVKSHRRILLETRRTVAECEQAEHDYKQVRSQCELALATWKDTEAKRDRKYHEKFSRVVAVLVDLSHKCMIEALHSTSHKLLSKRPAATSEPSLNAPTPTPDQPIIFDSEEEAELFFFDCQRLLQQSLIKRKVQFVFNVRGLANRAHQERFESLKTILKSLVKDVQPDLRNDILANLDDAATYIPRLALKSVRKTVKAERQRYGLIAAFRMLETKVVSSFLPLPDDEEEQQKAIAELGFMLRAPISAVVVVPFVLGAFVLSFATKSKTYNLNKEALMKTCTSKIVNPFIDNLTVEGEKSLRETMSRGSIVARAAVTDALEKEDERYSKERREKQRPPMKEYISRVIALHANFVAAEAALQALRVHLLNFI